MELTLGSELMLPYIPFRPLFPSNPEEPVPMPPPTATPGPPIRPYFRSPSSFSTSESLQEEASGRRRAVEAGAGLSVCDMLGNSPLHNAVLYFPSTQKSVDMLLKNGADVAIKVSILFEVNRCDVIMSFKE